MNNNERPYASVHGEKFGGSVRSTRRTDALNTRRAPRPLFSQTALPIRKNHYPELGEPLREMLGLAVLSQALSSVWGNQWANFRVGVTLNQREATHTHHSVVANQIFHHKYT